MEQHTHLNAQEYPHLLAISRSEMDLLGPFQPATWENKYVMVTIDYLMKLVEAKPLTIITSQVLKRIFWKNIICRFGVPRELIVDNGNQFDAMSFTELCDLMGTKMHLASVSYQKRNGIVKRVN